MHIKKELGKNIKKYRKLNNMTQEKLAEFVGVEINSISSIETGKYFPTPDNLVKITKALNITLSELFDFKEEYEEKNYIEEINRIIGFIKADKTKLCAVYSFIKLII